MTREDSLQVVLKVKLKPTVVEAFDALCLVENYIKTADPFSYRKLMDYIQSLMPTKLGGVYIDVAKGLRYLKNELYVEQKRIKG